MAGYRGGAGEDFGWSVEGNDRFAEWKGGKDFGWSVEGDDRFAEWIGWRVGQWKGGLKMS